MIRHSEWIFGPFMLALVALVIWAFWMLPQWTRPGIYFGVTVQPDFRKTPEAQRMLRRYRIEATTHVAIAFAMILASSLPTYQFLAFIGAIWLVVGPLTAFVEAHKRVQRHAVQAATVREAILEPRNTRPPGGWVVQAGPLAILLATGAFLHFHWDEIPARFPVHWMVEPDDNGGVRPIALWSPNLCVHVAHGQHIASIGAHCRSHETGLGTP